MTTSEVILIQENEDGSAILQFNFSKEELDALTRYGIVTAIMNGVKEAEKLHPNYVEEEKKEEA